MHKNDEGESDYYFETEKEMDLFSLNVNLKKTKADRMKSIILKKASYYTASIKTKVLSVKKSIDGTSLF